MRLANRCLGLFDVDGGVSARKKLPKLANSIFNNQQGLEVAMEDCRGVAQMGGNDDQ